MTEVAGLVPATFRLSGTVIPGRASSREPGIQAAVPSDEVLWIPGSVLRTAPE
jgi:hypothetical protein